MEPTPRISRRDYLRRGLLTVATVGAGALLTACKGGGRLKCNDVSGLQPAEVNARTASKYVDKSPRADQNCLNCVQYTAGAEGQCGGCKVLKGPINPKGWCTLWAAKS